MDGAATPNPSSDEAAVVAVALDYFEGWFDGDVERMDRALHPDLVKRSHGKDQAASLGITTKQTMLELTAAGDGAEDGVDRRLDIEVLEVYEDLASVRVHSAVYYEYLHLVRTRDGWKIANALWRHV
jgi:putative lumazine-binding protein